MSAALTTVMAYFRGGGVLMWLLLGCSLLALTVILERFYFWARLRTATDRTNAEKILLSMDAGVGAPATTDKSGPISAMLEAGIMAAPENCALAMEIRAGENIGQMQKGMKVLDTIITAAPMLGILGTVTGIMSSFDVLGASTGANQQELMAGLAQALITTAYGLGISVFTIFPYNYFNSRIEEMAFLFELYGGRLEEALVAHGKNADNES